MKVPRDLDGPTLIRALQELGYRVTRQTGSHVRLTCDVPSKHHLTVPKHRDLRIGTLASILNDVAVHHQLSRDELLVKLFG